MSESRRAGVTGIDITPTGSDAPAGCAEADPPGGRIARESHRTASRNVQQIVRTNRPVLSMVTSPGG
jgi:hypothetical protein